MSSAAEVYPVPTELYHYTTNKALLSIIANKEIWLSDVRFLNDSEEFTFSQKVMVAILDALDISFWTSQLQGLGLDQEYEDKFVRDYSRFRNGFFGPAFHLAQGYATGVFCLSSERDSLAQWRGYGNQEVCIGFNPAVFQREPFPALSLGQVRYFDRGEIDVELMGMVTRMLDKYVERAKNNYESGNPISTQGQLFLEEIHPFEPLFIKHSGFASENEWRVIVRKPALGLPAAETYFLRDSPTVPIPTIRQQIDIISGISSITFGPGADEKLVKTLETFLIYKMVPGPRWTIRKSAIPYRG